MHTDIDWNAVAHEFEWDGSLRDVYVLDATLADWQAVLDAIAARYLPLRFLTGETPAELPAHVTEAFSFWSGEAPPFLGFSVDGVTFACHFFATDAIEFDFDPRDVSGPESLASVLAFLGELARLTGRTAVLTPENLSDAPIFRADPMTDSVEYVPPPSRPGAR
jgi:hypothetical protein